MVTKPAPLIALAICAALLSAPAVKTTAAKTKRRPSCYDNAWQSQAPKDCLATARKS